MPESVPQGLRVDLVDLRMSANHVDMHHAGLHNADASAHASINITMRAGVALYDKYGPNMTAEQFHTGLMDVVNHLDAAQRAGQNVPQIKALP